MESWKKTIVTWPMWSQGGEIPRDRAITNIPVSNAPKGIAAFYVCSEIRIESHQERKMLVKVSFNHGEHPVFDWNVLREKFERMGLLYQGKVEFKVLDMDKYAIYGEVPLHTGEQFLERAVEVALGIIKELGIVDVLKQMGGNLKVAQETLVLKSDGWEPIEEGLRKKYGLMGPYIFTSGN